MQVRGIVRVGIMVGVVVVGGFAFAGETPAASATRSVERDPAWYLQAAMEDLANLTDARQRDGALAQIARAQASCGHLDQAIQTFGQISDASYRAGSLGSLVIAMAASGGEQEAERLLPRLEEGPFRRLAEQQIVYAKARAAANRGDVGGAMALIQGLPEPAERAPGYVQIGSLLWRTGKKTEAREAVRIARAELDRGPGTGAEVGGLIVSALLEFGDIDAAKHFAGGLQDPFARDFAMLQVTLQDARDGRWNKVDEALELVEVGSLRQFACESVAETLMRKGDLAKAKEYTQKALRMHEDGGAKWPTITLVSLLAGLDQGESARRMVAALEVGQRVPRYAAVARIDTRRMGAQATTRWVSELREPQERAACYAAIAAALGTAATHATTQPAE